MMRMLARTPDPVAVTRPAATIPDEWRAFLNGLRVVALQCRAAARTDLFKACALIANKQDPSKQAFAQALFKCLRQAVNTKPVFYQPGTAEMSFDEAWLIRAIMAAHQGDDESFSFLVRSRVAKIHQRPIGFLIKGISGSGN